MKFVCPSCKAKYQIADEKITGRTLKMDCRRCNTPITIRGDLPAAADVEQVAEARPASVRPPAAAQTSRRPAGAAGGGSSVGPHPSRPRGHQPGAAAHSLAPQASSALGADFRRQSIAPQEARASVLDQWHVAINDVPVGPMRREEVSRKIAAGAVNQDSLAWREGFDDWRPVRDIPDLAALLRRAEQPRGVPAPRAGLAGRAAPPAPAARAAAPRPAASSAQPHAHAAQHPHRVGGNVVAIGGRMGGAAPALEEDLAGREDEESPEEPTQIASAAELGLLAFGDANALRGGSEAKAKAPERPQAKAAMPAPGRKPEPVRAPEPIAAAPARTEPKRTSFAPPPPADDGLPPLVQPTGEIPAPLAPAAASMASAPAALPIAAPEREADRRRAIPPMAWIGIAGAVAFGAVFAVIAAQRFLPPAANPAAGTATVIPAVPTEPHEAPLVEPPVETPPTGEAGTPPDPPVGEVAPEVVPPEGGPRHTGTSGHRTPPTGGHTTAPAAGGRTDPETSAALERLIREESGSGPAVIAGGATERRLGGSDGTSARAELTEDQIRAVVTRERNGLTRCWETAIRGMRETPTVRLDVAITIGSSGTVTRAAARGPTVGTLTECIERSVQRWRFPASSGSTETAFPVVFSGTN